MHTVCVCVSIETSGIFTVGEPERFIILMNLSRGEETTFWASNGDRKNAVLEK